MLVSGSDYPPTCCRLPTPKLSTNVLNFGVLSVLGLPLPLFLPNRAPPPSFCHGRPPPVPRFCQIKPHCLHFVMANYLLPPFLPNRASRCSVWQKRTLPPLFRHGRPPPVPVFAKSNTWMLDLAKTSPTAFVLSRPIATCPRFCQIEHLNARVGKNEPPLPSVCHGRPPPAPFLPNRAPGRSVWQKQGHHLRFVTANHHLPRFCQTEHWMLGLAKTSLTAFALSMPITTCSVFAKSSTWTLGLAKTRPPPTFCHGQPPLAPFLPNRALDAQFGKNEPYRLRFVNAHHHLPTFLPNRASKCSVWQKRAPPLTPFFPNPDMKDMTKLVASFCLWVLLYCSFIPLLVVNPVFSDLMHDSQNLT